MRMKVAELLKAKGSRVVTTRPEVAIQAAVHRMTLEGIGALVVLSSDDDHVVGVVSERDIACALSDHGADVLKMHVADIMNCSVRTCAPEDSVKHVMEIMSRGRIRHLPVIDDQRLRGVISIGDVVKNRLQDMELEVNVLRDSYLVARTPVS